MATFIPVLPGGVSTTSFADNTAGANTLQIGLDSYIVSTSNDYAASIDGPGTWTFKIDGGLWADSGVDNNADTYTDGTGLVMYNFASAANNKVTVGVEGTIGGSETGIFSSVAADVTNSGVIGGGRFGFDFFGKAGPGQDGTESNLNIAGKKILIDNKVGADIQAEFIGINNNSFAALTVKNASHIGGGANRYLDQNDDDNDDDGYTGAAINTNGALTFTNAATGVVDGNVETGWIGNKIDNAGRINGTINSHVDTNKSGIIDINRDGDFLDVEDIFIGNLMTIVDTIINKGTLFGLEDYGWNDQGTPGVGGDDTFFQVAIDLSNGKDVVTNSGKIFGDVWLGGGDDTLTNSGFITGFVDGSEGINTITNKGTILYGVGGQNQADKLTNSGTIGDDYMLENKQTAVNLNGGDDLLINTGTIKGTIELGSGNDTLTGGKNVELVNENDGADIYTLADGNDYLWVYGDDGDIDSFDGGKNVDTLDLFNSGGQAVVLDLTAKTMQFDGGAIDTVFNFENVIGTQQADTLKGSALAETLSGDSGSDTITGRGGKDILYGGADADSFVYELATDSGKTRATRDVIKDFQQGVDGIDLQLDANSLVAGPQNFSAAIVANGAFTGVAGQLRFVWQGNQTIVEGDTNADGKADFSIALDGIFTLTSADFIL